LWRDKQERSVLCASVQCSEKTEKRGAYFGELISKSECKWKIGLSFPFQVRTQKTEY